MAEKLSQRINAALPELRFQPSLKRIRARLGDTQVVDTTRAVLVWEPMRVVPQWAVPADDLLVNPEPSDAEPPPAFTARTR